MALWDIKIGSAQNSVAVLPSSHRSNFKPPRGKLNSRRISVLNALFTQYIADIMSTGELSEHVLGLGLEISRVKVENDFSAIKVYWLSTGNVGDDVLEKILKSSSGKLRHELSQLHLIGHVPYIYFLKDKEYGKTAIVERLLADADFGEEFEPTDPSHDLKSTYLLRTQLSPKLKAQIEELDSLDDAELAKLEALDLPEMRMDVLGFDLSRALVEVKVSLNKAKALHRMNVGLPDSTSEGNAVGVDTPSGIEGMNSRQRNEEFTEFLLKRQRAKAKALKREKCVLPEEIEYSLEQANKQRQLLWELGDEQFEEESDYEDESFYDDLQK